MLKFTEGLGRSQGSGSEVLIMVHKMGLVPPVDKLARLLHILGHPWRTTAEDSDLTNLSMERRVPWSLELPAAQGSQLVQPDYKKQISTLDPGKKARAGGG